MRVTTKENITTIFGFSESTRIADPENSDKVFKWLPEWSYDEKGNCFEFEYMSEDLTDLYSVPSHLEETPELVKGGEIGSSKHFAGDEWVLMSSINPHLNR